MDASQVDRLMQCLTSTRSRRNAGMGLLGFGLASLVRVESEEVAAKKRKKKKKKKQSQASPPPLPPPPPPPPPSSPRQVVTRTFSSTDSFAIPGTGTSGPANVYPSEIVVGGLTNGIITDVNVRLNGLNHTSPADIEILLVATQIPGINATIVSDLGGATDAVNVNLVLDDQASTPLPDNGPLVSGTFQPQNRLGADVFPSPAPTATGNSSLSAFNGLNPNGTWQLFIADDANSDTGSLTGSWALEITAEVDAPAQAQRRDLVPAKSKEHRQRGKRSRSRR